MAKFEESKHPRDKDGKFTFKKPNDKYLKNAEYQDRLRTHSEKRKQLENKYNSELPGKPNKDQLTKQEWALWYQAVAKNKKLGYWAEELENGDVLLKVETKYSVKIVITGGMFEQPKAKAVFSFSSSDEMIDAIGRLKVLWINEKKQ